MMTPFDPRPALLRALALLLAIASGCAPANPPRSLVARQLEQSAADDSGDELDPLEEQADEEQRKFEEEYDLVDPDTGEEIGTETATGTVDWRKMLRPSVRVRQGRGRDRTTRVVVPDVTYGVVLPGPANYSEGARRSIAPASTNKIYLATLALRTLGPGFRFGTTFSWRASGTDAYDVEIEGSGDPSIESSSFATVADRMAEALLSAGIRVITGEIAVTATDRRWALRTVPAGWESGDLRDGNGVIPTAFGVLSDTRVRSILRSRLEKKGIRFVETRATPSDAAPATVRHESKPLKDLIQPILLRSINPRAEALLRKCGEVAGARTAESLHAAGLELLRETERRYAGEDSGAKLYDGSGLSRKSRVTAEGFAAFLSAIRKEPFFDELLAALPVAGRSGTLQHRMRGTAAEGRVAAKTGTLNGHYELAGYLKSRSKGVTVYKPFVILTETGAAGAAYCRSVQDKVLARLAGLDD
jgi:D-alanyl-D-alanine carboxypeptidase/D-alanyl-D-alanine-endopeptidase (penicillin-binding protein 4)